ncbi:hypothetical protein L209DRAFT_369434 [Thermothelomyces heterothallicus CBS 203.75]
MPLREPAPVLRELRRSDGRGRTASAAAALDRGKRWDVVVPNGQRRRTCCRCAGMRQAASPRVSPRPVPIGDVSRRLSKEASCDSARIRRRSIGRLIERNDKTYSQQRLRRAPPVLAGQVKLLWATRILRRVTFR